MERSPYDFNKKLKILKEFFSSKAMIVNTNKTKVMIIKSQDITYTNFIHDNNNNLEQLTSYKYLGTNIHHKLN